jgi:hypothetical protein
LALFYYTTTTTTTTTTTIIIIIITEKAAKIQEFMYRDAMNVEYEMYDYTGNTVPLIIIADNVINQLLLSKSVVPKHSI